MLHTLSKSFLQAPNWRLFLSDPCSGMSCGANSRASCVLAKTKGTRCICFPDCKDTFRGKVCSTDQRTYSSECSLLTESCRARKKMEVDYFLQCQGWQLQLLFAYYLLPIVISGTHSIHSLMIVRIH